MKQFRNGQKVQNWHRPPKESALNWRFAKERFADPAAELEATEYLHTGADRFARPRYVFDDHWDCYNPQQNDWYNYRDDNYRDDTSIRCDDYYAYVVRQVIRELECPSLPLIPSELIQHAQSAKSDPSDSQDGSLETQTTGDIDRRLKEYLDRLAAFASHSAEFVWSTIRASIVSGPELSALKLHANRYSCPCEDLVLFSPFWIRQPSAWSGQGGLREFLKHLFARYEIPQFLFAEWSRSGGLEPRLKWISWFILFSQGGSLKHASKRFHWNVANKFQHFLHLVPSNVSPVEGCIIAEVLRLGGNEIDYTRILENPAFVVDPTEESRQQGYAAFWQETVHWLIAHRDTISDEQCRLILAWAMHEHTESRYTETQFSWKGRQPRSVLERAEEYYQATRRANVPWMETRWNPHGLNWNDEQSPTDEWTFVELCSGAELFEEGRALQHCVAGYSGRCSSGVSAIVSLRHNGNRVVTIELNPTTLQIAQARGSCNQLPKKEERQVITRWHDMIVQTKLTNLSGVLGDE